MKHFGKRHPAGMVILIIMLLLCRTAAAHGGEEFRLRGSVTGRDTGVYPVNFMMSTGPGWEYAPVDYNVCCDLDTSEVKVFTQVWSGRQLWILVEAPHLFLGKVRGYMVAIDEEGALIFNYNQDAVPWEDPPGSFLSVWACQSYENIAMRLGPGEQYIYSGTAFSENDEGYVVLTEGEWALVEGPYQDEYNEHHYHRGWVRFDELIY